MAPIIRALLIEIGLTVLSFPGLVGGQAEFELEGSVESYATFAGWTPCQNGSLELDFRTPKSSQLLLYQDSGQGEYIQVKMVRRVAMLRWSLGDRITSVLTAGHDLDDDLWHHLEIRRDGTTTYFTIDNLERSRKERGDDLDFGESAGIYYLYVGGLPLGYNSRQLANRFTLYEPRFKGSVRNLRYSNCGGPPQNVDIIESEGLRETQEDPCKLINPCLHGGMCIATDMGAICDCTGTGHFGQFCEKAIMPREATFFGSEYLSYDLSQKGEPVVSTNDKVIFQFKTRQSNGLIVYTGDGSDFLVIALLEGGLLVHITLLSGSFEVEISPSKGFPRFDDNKWHSVLVERKSREINLEIDKNITQTGTIVGEFTILSSRVLYVGGSPSPGTVGDVRIVDNFRGCLKQIIYQADSISLDILRLAESDPSLITSHGNIAFNKCQDVRSSQPVTFSDEKSYLTLPKWNPYLQGSFSFQFRTNEPNGLLLYGRHGKKKKQWRFSKDMNFFAVELLDGFLYLVVNLGYGVEKVVAYGYRLDDSLPHRVTLTHQGKKGLIDVDGEKNGYRIKGKGQVRDRGKFDVYLGGLGPSKAFPYQVWTAMLNQGFIGCIQDVVIDGDNLDLTDLVTRRDADGISLHCPVVQPQCSSYPCLHNGVCRDGWNRFICDCSGTSFTGSICQIPAVTLSFDGTQYLEVTLAQDSITEAEDVSLRFRTSESDGLLFVTSSKMYSDSLKMTLDDAQVTMTLTLAGHSKSISMGQALDDDNWHTVWVKRRAQILEMRLDNSSTVQEIMDAPDVALHVDNAYFGSHTNTHSKEKNGELVRSESSIQLNNMRLARQVSRADGQITGSSKNFKGQMQQFVFNDNAFFDMVRTGNVENIHTDADIVTTGDQVSNPVTFRTTSAYLTTTLRLYGTFTIYFQLKTTQPDGLILFSGSGEDKDFLALELVDGKLKYTFNVGSGPRIVKANLRQNINDNKWHQIALVRHTLETHMLRVDDTVAYDNLPDGSSVHFDTPPVFYIGGVRQEMYETLPDKVRSREGFQGCLGSLDIDGDSRNILEHHRSDIPEQHQDDVQPGCEGTYVTETGPKTECSETSCDNGGVCIQQWESYTCDCDMTSFTGPRCEQDGIAYSFGSSGGLIHFSYADSELHNTKHDQLALGFITEQKDAILARIDSRGSEDYIEMELVDGNIFVVYNMGTMDHPIGQLFDRVDDGEYHVVRFVRNGANASIELDNTAPQYKNPSGSQLTIFNRLGDIYVGGRRDKEGRIVRPFTGTVAGFVLNGNAVLEKAAEGDSRVKIEGDVQLLIQPLHRPHSITAASPTSPGIVTPSPKDISTPGMQSTMRVKTTPKGAGSSDDIMFINPDCEEVDIEDCPDPDPNAFISPTVTMKPTRKPPTIASDIDDAGDPCQPDDEDCLTGSGSGFIGESVSTPHTDEQTDREHSIDIDLDKSLLSDRTTTDTPKIIIDVNMTEQPLRPDTRRPLLTPSSTPPAGSGPGGGGAGNMVGSDDSGLDPLKRGGTALGMNIGLIVGIAVGVVLLLLIIAFAFYKYKSRDEGSYKIDESKNYSYETCNTKPPPQANGGLSKSGSNCAKSKKNVKEWYV